MDLETKHISGKDFREIIRFCGYNLKEFSEFSSRSYAWIRQDMLAMNRIPVRFFDELSDFVGEVNFEIAFKSIQKKRERKREKIKKIRESKA